MKTALYKACYEDQLVCVGVSKSVLRRVSEHQWVEPTSVTVEYFTTRDAAEAEERRLIEANAPAYNVMHNHLEREKRSQRLRRRVHGPDVAEILKRARRLAGLTQQDLALRLGTSQQTISVYETGRRQPMMSTLTRLLAGCGLEMRIQLVPTTDE